VVFLVAEVRQAAFGGLLLAEQCEKWKKMKKKKSNLKLLRTGKFRATEQNLPPNQRHKQERKVNSLLFPFIKKSPASETSSQWKVQGHQCPSIQNIMKNTISQTTCPCVAEVGGIGTS